MMGYGYMGIWGWLWMLLFWGGLVVLVIWLISQLFPTTKQQDSRSGPPPSAKEILDMRYAQGELSRDQYQEIKQTLQE